MKSNIRRAIKRGTVVNATVESYGNGLATVLLPGGKTHLTNLSTTGGTIVEGDKVIVDYSSGVAPVVRPLNVEDTSIDESLTIAPLVEAERFATPAEDPLPEEGVMTIDVGCAASAIMMNAYDYIDYRESSQHLASSVWTPMLFGQKDPYSSVHGAGVWDTHNMIDLSGIDTDHVTIKVSGKYLIWAGFANFDAYWNNYTGGTGYYGIAIAKNSSEIARVTNLNQGMGTYSGLQIEVIEECNEGDIVQLLLWQSAFIGSFYYKAGGWDYPDEYKPWRGLFLQSAANELRLQLIPGTQGD